MSRSIWKGPYVHPSTSSLIVDNGWTLSQLLGESSLDDNSELQFIKKTIKEQELSRSEIIEKYGVEVTDRASTILPSFVGKLVKIHKGNGFKGVEIRNEHVGMKLGSLISTKKIPVYKRNKK